jgi:hypothetical protein
MVTSSADSSIPVHRRLRVYAFDPYLGTRLETEGMNSLTLHLPWERLRPGPVGEYLEIVDYDPASGCFYAPLDLNTIGLLAQDGHAPSEGNPQFHRQMVYAVCMNTIRTFERALGRSAMWSDRRMAGGKWDYVPRLRVYPHALRSPNAYYSPDKKALLFGYFPASSDDPGGYMPGGIVFTCLSHDIIAHETSHALLDGMHRRFTEPSNPDVFAFHEAFADIVALFQHFSFPEVLRHQIAKTRGDLTKQSLLGQLAQEFGKATGSYGALRDALGDVDPVTKEWRPRTPDPRALSTTLEPHDRGSLLVAAVFDAFVSIYSHRSADLLRIATGGTRVLPAGDIHPDLVNRLAAEAAKAATHILTMCVRALDYCPPVDITFGEYLRALITADYELVKDDDRGYRVAVIDAFRRHGIYPRSVRTMSEESLRWEAPGCGMDIWRSSPLKRRLATLAQTWRLSGNRAAAHREIQRCGADTHKWLRRVGRRLTMEEQSLLGLDLTGHRETGVTRDDDGKPVFEVHSVRPADRVGPDGQTMMDLIIEITQRRPTEKGELPFRGGCTLVMDLGTAEVRYCIRKDIGSRGRAARQREHQRSANFGAMADRAKELYGTREWWTNAFALLHSGLTERDGR